MIQGHGSPLYVIAARSGDGDRIEYHVYNRDGLLPDSLAEYDIKKRIVIVKDTAILDRAVSLAPRRALALLSARPYPRLFGETDYSPLFPEADLELLGSAMVWPEGGPDIPDGPIAAGFTYLGQLVFHDITWLDPDLQKPHNKASSMLDFTSITGPDAQCAMPPEGPFAIGKTLALPLPSGAVFEDLPRLTSGDGVGQPVIADSRNDSFLPLAQMHMLFLKFFNSVARCEGWGTDGYSEKHAQRLFVLHAQHMVIDDYLRKVIDPCVYCDVVDNGRRFIYPGVEIPDDFEVSIEFAVAVGRFGHAMVRRVYVPWNTADQEGNIDTFTHLSYKNRETERPLHAIPNNWTTTWHYLFDLPCLSQEGTLLRAALIGPHVSHPFGQLSERIRQTDIGKPRGGAFNLAAETLKRQRSIGLAPAETAIAIMNGHLGDAAITPLSPDQLAAGLAPGAALLFGKDGAFRHRTPLWFYVLREAELLGSGNYLGPFGSRVVMETLHASIAKSEISILKERGWEPVLPCVDPGHFTMSDLIGFATKPCDRKEAGWTGDP